MTDRDELWAGMMVEREELWEGLDDLDTKPMEMIPIVGAAIKQMRELGADEEQIAKILHAAGDELRAVAGDDQAAIDRRRISGLAEAMVGPFSGA